MENVYDYIDHMRARPDMYTREKSLASLELLLHGYCACVQANVIQEKYEGRKFHPTAFSGWLFEEFGWSGNLGFANSIDANSANPEEAFDTFFDLVQRFRQSEGPAKD